MQIDEPTRQQARKLAEVAHDRVNPHSDYFPLVLRRNKSGKPELVITGTQEVPIATFQADNPDAVLCEVLRLIPLVHVAGRRAERAIRLLAEAGDDPACAPYKGLAQVCANFPNDCGDSAAEVLATEFNGDLHAMTSVVERALRGLDEKIYERKKREPKRFMRRASDIEPGHPTAA